MLRATMKIPSSLALECTLKKVPTSITDGTMRKTLSVSATNTKRFVINDHYEFDQKVVNSDNPVIVNFHAEWCDPCKILTPKMAELLEPLDDIDLAVVDVDSNIDLVNTFEVKAVPAILAFRNGVVVDKFIGLVDSTMIENLIKKLKKKKES
ncbi:thioredoxin, mitochondrial [Contarinia nasturtii]|uniref:thioredoxin, mitochondrial n=1 Tax=Contarinia nasturtii TaxID=265458 RepID=UPI0012D4132F|nr:thioredoxin, mitochondrial [Contarinia nasturtii]XP_031635314.1 thioredoxin, mitochondrial [Contarinia nasturtii]